MYENNASHRRLTLQIFRIQYFQNIEFEFQCIIFKMEIQTILPESQIHSKYL